MADVSTEHAVRVAFRTDVSSAIGLGHLGRCLALAHALRAVGVESLVLLDGDNRALDLAMTAGLQASAVACGDDRGATVECCGRLGVSALVVDSYAFSSDDFRALVAAGRPVIVFDDTATRELPVDLVINGGVGAGQLAYRGSPHTRYLLGPRYLALRPEFAEAAPRTIHDHVQRALLTIGGADPGRLTARLVRWAVAGLGAITLDVVAGPLVDDVASIRAAVRSVPGRVTLHESPKHLHDLMLAADLAITGGGQTVYELAASGTPMVAIRLAENQRLNVEAMRAAGVLEYAGDVHDAALEPVLVATLAALAADTRRRAEMSQRGRDLVDGRGAARLARAVVDLLPPRR
jgi:UDP-2,4-diacetamido-2,4,6-trideoxy-beta-L-altropyranose hydrolase